MIDPSVPIAGPARRGAGPLQAEVAEVGVDMLTPKKTLNRTKGKGAEEGETADGCSPEEGPRENLRRPPVPAEQPSHHGFRPGEADDLRRQAYPYLISVDAPPLCIKGRKVSKVPRRRGWGFRTARSENDPVGKNVPKG